MLIRSLVTVFWYLAWDRKLGLLSLARSVNSSKRRRPGMGHLLGKKKKQVFENKFMYIKKKERKKMIMYSPLSLEMQLVKKASPPILMWTMNNLTTQQAARPANKGMDTFYSWKFWPSMSSWGGSWLHLCDQPVKLFEWSHHRYRTGFCL